MKPHLLPPGAQAAPLDWLGKEAPLTSAILLEVRRLARRARRRLGATLLVALLFFALPGWLIWMRKPPQRAILSLAFVPRNGVGYANREVRAYVESVLLSRDHLAGLIKRLGLVGNLERRDLDAAVQLVRERLEIEAYPQLAPADALGEQAPGARVRIVVVHADAAKASELADGILQLITETEQARREAQARYTRAQAEGQLAQLAAQRTSLVAELARLSQRRAELPADSVARHDASLQLDARAAQLAQVDALADDVERLAATHAYEAQRAAASVSDLEVLDVVRPDIGQKPWPGRQVGLSVIALLGCLAAAGALVAAFDRRVDAPADLLRLGTLGLGTWRLPPPSGGHGE